MGKTSNPAAVKARIKARNEAVSKMYQELSAKHPQWRHSALVELVAEKFFLAPATIQHIINGAYERYHWAGQKAS
jgi:hypothetical protein